jgi:SpoVK/Ycf46/Vps4 family AAA+-type ATPase
MLSSEYGDLAFTALPVPTADMDLALNYGDSFLDIHTKLVDNLNNTTSGLYLFYGAPGTGKSSYIKYLLSAGIDRKIAYIPVGLIDKLTHPDMLPLLMNNKNIILVLEDAEKALLSREISQDSSIVSTILNLTDGFIGQAINISIVATFNTAKDKIDEALLRKGRLRMSHEFKKLPVANCKKIASSLGVNPEHITEDMSLAEIYNYEEDANYKAPEERRVGFC